MRRSKICLLIAGSLLLAGCDRKNPGFAFDRSALAKKYFQEDSSWYLNHVPFFECSDTALEEVYYYRWKLFKAHLRETGPGQFVVTEFINDVHWDRDPYSTINAATMHHIYEGRWLTDDRYINGYINYMYQEGGNNRQYSESIADATYARFLVNGDTGFVTRQLENMKKIYEGWDDHWDSSKNLYFIPAMPDATEYTIASIDASGGKDGFEGGDAFRPTINSYMYGNAMAISKIAEMTGDHPTADLFTRRAANLKKTVEKKLWNPSLSHFTDRYKIENRFVHAWDFIRGRELAGMIPWYFNLPADSAVFNAAWKHCLDTTQLLGKFGLRTNEPSYEYYFKQYVYTFGKRGSQWNGPSWPYQSSQAIHAMANLLNNYQNHAVTKSNYVQLLRQFAKQHYLPDGKINLVENYDPNKGGPIVYFYWSNDYNHSAFNDLIISGLCGIRASAGDTLEINPLVDESISYFWLDDVRYHGRRLTLVYDVDGNHYGLGEGLVVMVDGARVPAVANEDRYRVAIRPAVNRMTVAPEENFALNINRKGFPVPTASVNNVPDSVFQVVDGRVWYFPEITNQWTTVGSRTPSDWFAINFGVHRDISRLQIHFVSNTNFHVPEKILVEIFSGSTWAPVTFSKQVPDRLIGNSVNAFFFDQAKASKIRVTFDHRKDVAITEIRCY